MKNNLLDTARAIELGSKLKDIWDINKVYWYPLFDCKRQDVIAFDSQYIEPSEKLENIKLLLEEHGVGNVYEFRENGNCNEIIDFLDYNFWCSEPYFWNNECFWFDDNMDWIIYVSHEGTTTFGGEWLVKKLKSLWSDWKKNTKWDAKNK